MADLTHLLAVFLTLGGAVAAAGHHLFVRLGTDSGQANNAVIAVMLVNTIVLVPLVAVWYFPDYGLTNWSVLSFLAAGLVGSMVGRALMYSSIETIGASRTTPIVATWALFSTVLGVVFLGEQLSVVHGVGVLLIVAGVAAIAWETSQENPAQLSRQELLLGLLIPLAAAVAIGWEPIFASFGLRVGTPAPVGLVIKTVGATVGFTLYLRYRGGLPTLDHIEWTDKRWYLFAGASNTFFLLVYYVALDIAPVSVVSPLVVTNTLFVIVLSALFMPERLEQVTWRLGVAASVVVLGVLCITLAG